MGWKRFKLVFQGKWILYFAVEDSQNSHNPSKLTYSTIGFSIFLLENAHSWAQGIKTKFSRKVLPHGLKTRHTYVHPNILSMSKVNETYANTEVRQWWGALSEIYSVSARIAECIVFTHSELNKDGFSGMNALFLHILNSIKTGFQTLNLKILVQFDFCLITD